MKRAYVDVPEGQVHYRTEGNGGEVVLLLHMAESSSDEYARVIPFLSKTYRVIALDFLGFGESDKPPREYQIEDHARTVVSVMEALGIEKANIVGNRTGALIGVELAGTCPDRVDKLVLYSPPYFRDDNEHTSYTERPIFNRVEIKPDGGHLMEWWQRASRYGDPAEIVDERVLDLHKCGPRGAEMHWAYFAYTPKLPTKLPLIQCPTLVLAGTRDNFYSVAQEQKGLIPRSRFIIIENGPVYVSRIMPKEFAEAILNFLKNPSV